MEVHVGHPQRRGREGARSLPERQFASGRGHYLHEPDRSRAGDDFGVEGGFLAHQGGHQERVQFALGRLVEDDVPVGQRIGRVHEARRTGVSGALGPSRDANALDVHALRDQPLGQPQQRSRGAFGPFDQSCRGVRGGRVHPRALEQPGFAQGLVHPEDPGLVEGGIGVQLGLVVLAEQFRSQEGVVGKGITAGNERHMRGRAFVIAQPEAGPCRPVCGFLPAPPLGKVGEVVLEDGGGVLVVTRADVKLAEAHARQTGAIHGGRHRRGLPVSLHGLGEPARVVVGVGRGRR